MCSAPGYGRPRRNPSAIRASTVGSAPTHACWWLWQILREVKTAMSPASPLLSVQLTLTFSLRIEDQRPE